MMQVIPDHLAHERLILEAVVAVCSIKGADHRRLLEMFADMLVRLNHPPLMMKPEHSQASQESTAQYEAKIEVMARAICRSHGFDPDQIHSMNREPVWKMNIKEASAALEAIHNIRPARAIAGG